MFLPVRGSRQKTVEQGAEDRIPTIARSNKRPNTQKEEGCPVISSKLLALLAPFDKIEEALISTL